MAIYTNFRLKRSEEFQAGVNHATAPPQPSTFSEQYARDNDFHSQADMRGEDW